MKPIKFPEQTTTYAENQSEYIPLPVYRDELDANGNIIACWKLGLGERLKVMFTGKIWHQVLTFNKPLQPQLLTTKKPLMRLIPRRWKRV